MLYSISYNNEEEHWNQENKLFLLRTFWYFHLHVGTYEFTSHTKKIWAELRLFKTTQYGLDIFSFLSVLLPLHLYKNTKELFIEIIYSKEKWIYKYGKNIEYQRSKNRRDNSNLSMAFIVKKKKHFTIACIISNRHKKHVVIFVFSLRLKWLMINFQEGNDQSKIPKYFFGAKPFAKLEKIL